MYLSNKYTKWYYQIINHAKNRDVISGYTEKHHIIPKCLGGPNTKDNLATLSAREHFICHWLLTRMVTEEYVEKMNYAVWRMVVRGSELQERYSPSSRTYEKLRVICIENLKNRSVSAETCKKISEAKRGTPAWNKGIPRTDSEKQKMSEKRKEAAEISPPWNTGTKWSDDTKRKLSIKAKNRIKLQCNHCNKIADASNFGRWHGDSCRMKLT